MQHIPQQINTINRYKAVKARYEELYNGKRLRIDDVIKKLSEEFFMSEQTVMRILRTDVPDFVYVNGVKTKQGDIFTDKNQE